MAPRSLSRLRTLGRVEIAFLIFLLLDVILWFAAPVSGFRILVTLITYVLAVVVAVRLVRRWGGRVIWRLRNRLIVAYLFIAVVPVLLIMALVAIGTYVITGQVAVYLVNSELERRNAALAGPAHALARENGTNRSEVVKRLIPFLESRFPDVQLVARNGATFRYPAGARLDPPPGGWRDAQGFVVKEHRLYSWAHVTEAGTDVTILAPVTHELLNSLIPGLGDVFFLSYSDLPADSAGKDVDARQVVQLDATRRAGPSRVPPPYVSFDVAVTGASLVPVSTWEAPGRQQRALLVVHTRTSAVLGIVFGQKFDVGQGALLAFLGVAILFLIFELISLVIGISMTRTITGAVHNLYEGTLKISQGDFSHRIVVRGKDQLAELGISFNQMTANLERLIVVEKEKERLQSELEIAREVQNQLFPKNVPVLKTLSLTGICHPARMVSGDYYDFVSLSETSLALAIGDVAGKGISAALLMAAIQSTMRTQLTAGVPAAVAAGGAAPNGHLSTAALVSRLNKQLYANTSPEKYATFYFGVYDEAGGTLRYTNAGHLPPILVRKGQPVTLEVTGTVVGAFPFSLYEEQEVHLASGDLLVAYTDGIVEPENEYGEQFGEERLKELLVKHASEDSGEIIARVMESVEEWTGSSELQDDMTMLVARRL